MSTAEETARSRRLRSYGDEDIVRYTMSPDVPIVGLVRNREEYREMREIALIYGMTLGLSGKVQGGSKTAGGEAAGDETASPEEAQATEIPVRIRGQRPETAAAVDGP